MFATDPVQNVWLDGWVFITGTPDELTERVTIFEVTGEQFTEELIIHLNFNPLFAKVTFPELTVKVDVAYPE